MIELHDAKIIGLMTEKADLVNAGRKKSKEIEKIEIEIDRLDKKEREITAAANPETLLAQGEVLKKEINAKIEELQKISTMIQEYKIAAIPEDMKKKHYELRDKKEVAERERNKIALKVQKIKDRVIPLIRSRVIPQLGEYEDMVGDVVLKKDKIVITTVDKVEELKRLLKEKKKKSK